MKNIKNYIGQGLIFLVLIPFVFVACNDDEEATGSPKITNVRLTDPETAGMSLTQAPLGATIVVEGVNLGNVTELYMNDEAIDLNPAFVTDKNIIFTISDSIPTLATYPNVPNTIRVIARNGAYAIYDFQTLPPPAVITQISNELAKVGDEITLFGRYFYFVDSVVFPGDVVVTEGITTGANGTWLSVIVPEGFEVAENDRDILVASKSGVSSIGKGTKFSLGEGIVADFDNDGIFSWPQNGAGNWGWGIPNSNIVNTAPGIDPYDGYFGLVNVILAPDYAWANEKVINLANWAGDQIFPTAPAEKYEDNIPIANFAAKMEMAVSTSASIANLEVQIMVFDQDGTELTANVKMANFVKTTDGTWYTVTIPLDKVANNDTKLNRYKDLLKGGGLDDNGVLIHHYRVVIINPHPTEAVPVVLGIDNMRVENTVL